MSGRFQPTRTRLLMMVSSRAVTAGNRGSGRCDRKTHRADAVHEGQEGSHDAFLHLVLSALALRTQSVQLIDEDERRLSDEVGEKKPSASKSMTI